MLPLFSATSSTKVFSPKTPRSWTSSRHRVKIFSLGVRGPMCVRRSATRAAATAALLGPPAMFERALNAFWILLGAAAAAYAWTLGLIGASGPESGLFPFLAGLIIMGAGAALLLRPASENFAPEVTRAGALWGVLGVVACVALLAG